MMNSVQFEFVKPAGRTFFSSGDHVAGNCRVELTESKPLAFGGTKQRGTLIHAIDIAVQTARIDIVFSGRIEIRLFEKRMSNSHVRLPFPGNNVSRLFEERRTICAWNYPQTPKAGRYVYPFDFVFPAYGFVPPDVSLNGSSQPRLPPSTAHYGQTSQWVGSTRVVYEMEAQVVAHQNFCLRQSASEVIFWPFSWYAPPSSQGTYIVKRHAEIESHHLDKQYEDAAKISRAMKRITLAKAPVSHLDISVELPSHITTGEALPLFLGVEYDLERSSAKELPPVWLTGLMVHFRENMQIFQSANANPNSIIAHDGNPNTKFKFDLEAHPIRITERTDIRRFLPPDSLLITQCSFQGPLLRRFYDGLTMSATIVCAQKTITLDFQGGNELYIHPLSRSQAPVAMELMGDMPVVEEPPAAKYYTVPGGENTPIAELPFKLPVNNAGPRYVAEMP